MKSLGPSDSCCLRRWSNKTLHREPLRRELLVHEAKPDGFGHDSVIFCRKMEGSPPKKRNKSMYLTIDDVPPYFRTAFIHTGYRHPSLSATQCICSLFQIHNETLNIWTMLIPCIFRAIYLGIAFPSHLWPLTSIPVCYHPYLIFEGCTILLYLLSGSAHTFNAMSPIIHELCYYLDYGAILVCAFGLILSTFYYFRPLSTEFFLYHPDIFTSIAVFLILFSIYIACASRQWCNTYKYLIRTLTFSFIFLYASIPVFHRLLLCVLGRDSYTTGLKYYLFTGATYLLCAVLNTTKMPERHFPRLFDIVGQSHQWHHCFSVLGGTASLMAVQLEVEARKAHFPQLFMGLSSWNTLAWMFVVIAVNAAVISLFGIRLTKMEHKYL